MKRVVCAVFDSAVGAYGQPLFVPAIGMAIRSFTDEVNRSAADNMLFVHPEDFALYYLADFDDSVGSFVQPDEGVRCLIRGKDAKREVQ